jgi:acetoin utilization deacetylase AcuC-like enzyme
MFYDSTDVLYFSTHQFPYYPGTGSVSEVGLGNGTGFTINVPLDVGMGDIEYMKIFFEILNPVMEQFRPEIILVSAGFDTFYDDPLGGMSVTPEGFAQMTRFLKEAAERYCGGKIVFILEGGYNLDGLWLSNKEVVEELLEKKRTDYCDLSGITKADNAIRIVKGVHSLYWRF